MNCAITFAVIAVLGGAVGVTEFAGTALAIAKLVFFICLVVVSSLLSLAIFVGKR